MEKSPERALFDRVHPRPGLALEDLGEALEVLERAFDAELVGRVGVRPDAGDDGGRAVRVDRTMGSQRRGPIVVGRAVGREKDRRSVLGPDSAGTTMERRQSATGDWSLPKGPSGREVDAPSKRKEEELVRRVVETRELQFALT